MSDVLSSNYVSKRGAELSPSEHVAIEEQVIDGNQCQQESEVVRQQSDDDTEPLRVDVAASSDNKLDNSNQEPLAEVLD